MQLDLDDPRPPFQQVAALLRAEIQAGVYKPGMQLPSGSELAKRFQVARQTVQNAIKELKVEGLVASRQGSGVYVRDLRPAPTDLEAALADALTGGQAEVDYLGTNPVALANALQSRIQAGTRPGSRVPATSLSVRILARVRSDATPEQADLELTGVSDLGRLVEEAGHDDALSISIQERRTTLTPMFELYVVNDVEFIAFTGLYDEPQLSHYQVVEPSEGGQRARDVFLEIWKDAEPGEWEGS